MVFLVDDEGDALVAGDDDAALRRRVHHLLAEQLTLPQDAALHRFERRQHQAQLAALQAERLGAGQDLPQRRGPRLRPGTLREDAVGQIAGEADAGGEDDLLFRTLAAQPDAGPAYEVAHRAGGGGSRRGRRRRRQDGAALGGADVVAQSRRAFVVLGAHGELELATQMCQMFALLAAGGAAAGAAAGVPRLPVDLL